MNCPFEVSLLCFLESDRKCTDVACTIIGAIFALVMFILSLVMLNKGILMYMSVENYYKTNFPTDSDYKPCAYGDN